MATAIIGGLIKAGRAPSSVIVVEPYEPQRDKLARKYPGMRLLEHADLSLGQAQLIVWAVKPQLFGAAAAPCADDIGNALQLSVMAGIRSDTIAKMTGSPRVVRAMPNTPALIGQGISGLYARPAVGSADRAVVERVLAPTGQLLWFDAEADLDAVTALSGSGPAYVFYVIEAMVEAGTQMGLSTAAARALAQQTLAGAAQLAIRSNESPATLRERVTSKGGTTHAAITSLEDSGVRAAFVRALHAARTRAQELGRA